MKNLLFILSILVVFTTNSLAQSKLHYRNVSLDEAMQLAKVQKKKIFIDTYADYCMPCKVMDKDISRDRKMMRYFNDKFINIKVNMEGKDGPRVKHDYQVVFLPTLLIISAEGKILFRTDKKVSTKELLEKAKKVQSGEMVDIQPIIMAGTTISKRKLETVKPTPLSEVVAKTKYKKDVLPPSQWKEIDTVFIEEIIVAIVDTLQTEKLPIEDIIVVEEVVVVVAEQTEPEIKEEPRLNVQPSTTGESYEEEAGERILYVMGGDDEIGIPPEFLYREAYFRLQFGDGSHRDSYNRYLASQPDWSTDKNINMIYDFVYDTRSREFQFMLDNRELFNDIIGKDKIDFTIDLLIKDRINNGFPRPDLEEALALYKIKNPEDYELHAHQYYLNRLYLEECFDDYLLVGKKYLEDIESEDHRVMHKIAFVNAEYEEDEKELKKSVGLMELAISLGGENARYYDTLAYLHYKLKNKTAALAAAQKAIGLANGSIDSKGTKDLLKMIKSL